jgi:ATP-dependent Clp protease ATP-binding subunit ClpA
MSDPIKNLSPRAKKALALAEEEARRFNHTYLGVEHLLLGLAREGDGIAAKALVNLGVDTARLREAFVSIIGLGGQPVSGAPPVTPRLQQVFDLAAQEAQVRHSTVGTEHLLLVLAVPGPPGLVAQRILEIAGVDLAKIRPEITRLTAQSSGAGRTRDNVVTCRVDDRTLAALDALVETGVYDTRSEAAARLIVAGIEANQPLLEKVNAAVAKIRQVREEAQAATADWKLPVRAFDGPLPTGRETESAAPEPSESGTEREAAKGPAWG